MLGELSFRNQHLAAATESAASAYRVHVDPEASGRLQQRRAHGEVAPLAGGHEHHEGIANRHAVAPVRGSSGRPAPMAAFAASARPFAGRCPGRGGGRRLAEAPDPARAIRIVAHHHIRRP